MKKKIVLIIIIFLMQPILITCTTKNRPISDLTRKDAELIVYCSNCNTLELTKKSVKPLIGTRVHWTNQIASVFKEPAFDSKDWTIVVWYIENKENREDYIPCILEDIPHEIIDTLSSRDIITFEGTITGILDSEWFPYLILDDVEIVSVEKYVQ